MRIWPQMCQDLPLLPLVSSTAEVWVVVVAATTITIAATSVAVGSDPHFDAISKVLHLEPLYHLLPCHAKEKLSPIATAPKN